MKKVYVYFLASLLVIAGISTQNSLSATKKAGVAEMQHEIQMLEQKALYLKEIAKLMELIHKYEQLTGITVSSLVQGGNLDINVQEATVNKTFLQGIKQSIKDCLKNCLFYLVKWPLKFISRAAIGLGVLFAACYLVGGMALVTPLWAFVKTAFGMAATGIGSKICAWLPMKNWLVGKLFGRFCPVA